MNKTIRNIPDAAAATLKEQAAVKGLALEAYIRLILIETAEVGSKLGEIRTNFEVKLTKSARIVEINHPEPGETASGAVHGTRHV